MEEFSVTTKITLKEYTYLMYSGLYRKPGFIIGTIFGIYFIASIILNHFNVIHFYDETPLLELSIGLFLLLGPSLIVLTSVKQFSSNPNFKHDVTYTFGEGGIKVQGPAFKSEVSWFLILKQKEIGKFLVLYHTRNFGSFINKEGLTADQLAFIKKKIKQNKRT